MTRKIAGARLGLMLWAASAASQTAAPVPPADQDLRLRFDVNLVQVDAVVTDRKGRHVSGLAADEFEVWQDGVLQTIKHCAWVPPQPQRSDAGTPAVSPPLTRDQVRRTMVLLLDDSKMEFADFVFAQRALTRYFERELKPGDLAAVVRASGGSSAMQQLSGDPEYLRTVVRRMVWRPPAPTTQDNLLVLKQVLRGLRTLPGRKSVILISPGILLGRYAWDLLQQIADLASRCSVTIHTIDSHGLAVQVPYSVSEPSLDSDSRLSGESEWRLTPDFGLRWMYHRSRLTLSLLADMTAGLFQHDSNDLFGQVRKAAEDSEGYYLIGWYPGAGAFADKPGAPPRYHKLELKLKRKGLKIRSRRGYYAMAGMDIAPLDHFSPQAQMSEALFSPFQSSDIAVHLTPLFAYVPERGSFLKSLLHIRPEGIEFEPKDAGCATVRLEVFTSALPLRWSAPEGVRVHWRRTGLEVCGTARERALRDGLVVTVETPMERPGSVQLRVAVRNLAPGDDASPAVADTLVRRDSMTLEHIPVGSAASVLEIPDVRKADIALSGITLGGPGAPSGATQSVARLTTEGDPAIRQFHRGDPLTYEFQSFGRAASVETRIQVLRKGKTIYTSEPLHAKPGKLFSGTYKLDPSTESGNYLFGVVAKEPKGKAKSVSQWIDFEVME